MCPESVENLHTFPGSELRRLRRRLAVDGDTRGALMKQMIAAAGGAGIPAANTIQPADYLWTHKGSWTGFIPAGWSVSHSQDLK